MKQSVIGLVATPASSSEKDLTRLIGAFNAARERGWPGFLRPISETVSLLGELGAPLDLEAMREFPPVRAGGLVRMVNGLLVERDDPRRVDEVVFLAEPEDRLALVPEVAALKRQCVVQRRPFLPNIETACHWWSLASGGSLGDWRPEDKTIALVAHDGLKHAMLEFAARHAALLARFRIRYATGTTGGLLNGHLPERLTLEEKARLAPMTAPFKERDGWVECLKSGPKGGDVEIADMILDHKCDVVVFLEDPYVSREHDADIQLMERVVRLPGVNTVCFHDPATADLWASRLEESVG